MKRVEPWFRVAETVLIPPIAAWFNWRFEGLEQVPAEGPVLVAANHISYFDPLAHGRFIEKAGRRGDQYVQVKVDVPDALPRCIRVLLFWNTPRSQEEIVHVYLRDAERLRPDLTRERRGGTRPGS